MIFTQFIRHAGQSLRSFLDSLRSGLDALHEKERLNYVSRAKIGFNSNEELSLLGSHNIERFIRLAEGHYHFAFEVPYTNEYYSLVFAAGALEVLVVNSSENFIEVKALKDTELSLICVGEIV